MTDTSPFGRITNGAGEALDHAFHPAAGDPASGPILVIGHGVTANKDRAFLVALADGLAAAGVGALRFSFSGNGDSGGEFVDSTVTKEVADLGSVLDRVAAVFPGRPLGYVGHSMGAAVGVLRASTDDRIACLASLGGMVDTADFARRKFGDLTPGSDLMWDKPECPLSQAFMDDMAVHGSLVETSAKVTVPWLLVHGTADTVVPPEESRAVVSAAGADAESTSRVRLVEIEGADHLFTGDGTPPMVGAVVGWIQDQRGRL